MSRNKEETFANIGKNQQNTAFTPRLIPIIHRQHISGNKKENIIFVFLIIFVTTKHAKYNKRYQKYDD